MVLDAVRSLASNTIFLVEDASVDFSRWSTTSLLLFTTAEWMSKPKAIPNEVDVYILVDEEGQVDGLRQFGSIDLMISHLTDRIIEGLRSQAGDPSRAHKINERIDRFYQELCNITDSAMTKTLSNEVITTPTPILFWLTSRGANDEEDQHILSKTFKKRFLSYEIVEDPTACYQQIVKYRGVNHIFLVMNQEDYETSVANFEGLTHVKRIYCYGAARAETELTICGTNKLIYRLTCDLIDHYEKLAQQYQSNKQMSLAREMLIQAKDLCHFLSETCFAVKKSF